MVEFFSVVRSVSNHQCMHGAACGTPAACRCHFRASLSGDEVLQAEVKSSNVQVLPFSSELSLARAGVPQPLGTPPAAMCLPGVQGPPTCWAPELQSSYPDLSPKLLPQLGLVLPAGSGLQTNTSRPVAAQLTVPPISNWRCNACRVWMAETRSSRSVDWVQSTPFLPTLLVSPRPVHVMSSTPTHLELWLPAGSPNPTGSRAAVLGEFGGLGHRVADHQWIPEDSFSYEMEDTLPQLQTRYEGLVEQVWPWHSSCWHSSCLPWRCAGTVSRQPCSADDVMALAACMGGQEQV